MADMRFWTITVVVLGASLLSPVLGGGVSAADLANPVSKVAGALGGPEGVTPTPYDLEKFDTSVGAMAVSARDPSTFEIFGFKLGMSVREADRNARVRHLRFAGGGGTTASFDGRVAIAAASLLGRAIPTVPKVLRETSLIDADGARYKLQFLPMENGATLVSIAYLGTLQGNSPTQYLAALEARFGKPTHKSASADRFGVRWCSKGDDTLAYCNDRPAMSALGGPTLAIELLSGSRAWRELDQRVEAKAKAIAATQRKTPAF